MKAIVKTLTTYAGEYTGQGINYEGQPFIGQLSILPVVTDHGVAVKFTAKGLDGTLFHEEQSLVAPSLSEKLSLWNFNSNVPGLLEHQFRRDEKVDGAIHSFVFGFGNPKEHGSFREEVAIDLWPNQEVSYRYSWGLPGGSFESRSSVRMKPSTAKRNLFDLPANLPVPQDDGACDHLQGATLPMISLKSTADRQVNLREISEALTVFFFYPRTGRPDEPAPADWDDIPGARGCTPQSCGFRDQFPEFKKYGATVFGVSTQTTEYQKELVSRLHLPYEVLSDHDLVLTKALSLPTFDYNGMALIKRMAWVMEHGEIIKVFYPVFPSSENANTVLSWLRSRRDLSQQKMK